MKKDRFKQFADISLGVTVFYFILGLLLIVFGRAEFDFLESVWSLLFYIPLFTWHIFGIFSIISLIVKIAIWADRKVFSEKGTLINLALHIVFTVGAFGEMWWLFENCM